MTQFKKKEVLIISNSTWYLYNFKQNLIESLNMSQVNVSYFCLDNKNREKLLNLNCKPIVDIDQNTTFLKQLNYIKRSSRNKDINNIFTFTLIGAVVGYIFSAIIFRKAKLQVTVTGAGNLYLIPYIGPFLFRLIYKIIATKAERIYVQNTDDKKLLDKLVSEKSKIMLVGGSGVDLDKFIYSQPPNNRCMKFFIATRFIDNKGLKELFGAILEMQKEAKYGLKLYIAGDLDFKKASKKLKKLTNECMQNDAFVFLGHISEMHTEIPKYDCAILPSYREGLSRFLLEAAAVGRPLLVSNVPGCNVLVAEGVNGFKFAAKSQVSIKNCLEKFITLSESARAEMGQASRRLIESTYSQNAVNSKYVDTLDENSTCSEQS